MAARPGSDIGWLELQLEALFRADARGRLLHPNAPGEEGEPPPRFFFGRTRHGSLWRFGAGLPERTVAELARLASGERSDWPLEAEPERAAAMRARLEREAPITRVHHGPAFRFPDALARPEPAQGRDVLPQEQEIVPQERGIVPQERGIVPQERGIVPQERGIVSLTPARAELLGDELPALRARLALRQPCLAVLEGGRAVSVCYVAARSERAAEAGVETLPGFRGRGFASRAAAAWARAVAERGLLPLYSTEWSNRASRGVAARLGLILYGVDLHFR
jgi:hypothetical protein